MSRLPHMSIHECRVVKANLDAERANAAQRKRIVRNIVKLALGTIAAIVFIYLLSRLPHPVLGSTMQPRAYAPGVWNEKVTALDSTGVVTPEAK